MSRDKTVVLLALVASLVFVGSIGCGSNDSAAPLPDSTAAVKSMSTGKPGAPPIGNGTITEAAEEPLNAIPLKEAKTQYEKAKASLAKSGKDEKTKAAYVTAANTLADSTMMASELSPREKYPPALALYREVLKIDPTNHHATLEIDQMVQIYKSLGKPVPGGGG